MPRVWGLDSLPSSPLTRTVAPIFWYLPLGALQSSLSWLESAARSR
ncbi:MAG: hypothetical protein NW220_09500 [Leptolyngbyaceae cyanobacterium bins.349]|nr:hypothetical protein [Leptolyngbyaceae cyanobacterium bins.349]